MSWKNNALMFWNDGGGWTKVTDHNRSPLSIDIERIENKQRMADGTLRRQVVAKKRSYSCSWNMLPSKNGSTLNGRVGMSTVDGGLSGSEIEEWHDAHDGEFDMKLRAGTDEALAISNGTIEKVTVMITDFSKEVVRRGVVDYWNITITLEEV